MWNNLTMSQKANLMKVYLKYGISSLDLMKEHYNSLSEGGNIAPEDPPTRSVDMARPVTPGTTPETSDHTIYVRPSLPLKSPPTSQALQGSLQQSTIKNDTIDINSKYQNYIMPDVTTYDDRTWGGKKQWVGKQKDLSELWKENPQYDEDSVFATYNDRYLVAVNSIFGDVGDDIIVELDDGTKINAIIADVKADTDKESTKYGHLKYGVLSVVEFQKRDNVTQDQVRQAQQKKGWRFDDKKRHKSVKRIINTKHNNIQKKDGTK